MPLYAFDGTWAAPKQRSNVYLFYEAYCSVFGDHEAVYFPGIGAAGSAPRRLWEGATGWGTARRADDAFKDVCRRIEQGGLTTPIAVVGFSRGATSAFYFLNNLIRGGLDYGPDGYYPDLRFVGLFDMVRSVGIPLGLGRRIFGRATSGVLPIPLSPEQSKLSELEVEIYLLYSRHCSQQVIQRSDEALAALGEQDFGRFRAAYLDQCEAAGFKADPSTLTEAERALALRWKVQQTHRNRQHPDLRVRHAVALDERRGLFERRDPLARIAKELGLAEAAVEASEREAQSAEQYSERQHRVSVKSGSVVGALHRALRSVLASTTASIARGAADISRVELESQRRWTHIDDRIRQVYFRGVHTDVGGKREAANGATKIGAGLADISLIWMMSEAVEVLFDPRPAGIEAYEAWQESRAAFIRHVQAELNPDFDTPIGKNFNAWLRKPRTLLAGQGPGSKPTIHGSVFLGNHKGTPHSFLESIWRFARPWRWTTPPLPRVLPLDVQVEDIGEWFAASDHWPTSPFVEELGRHALEQSGLTGHSSRGLPDETHKAVLQNPEEDSE